MITLQIVNFQENQNMDMSSETQYNPLITRI